MTKVLFLTLTFLFISCANTQIKSTNKIPITFTKKDGFEKDINVVVTKEFFLWGMLPSEHELDVDDEIAKKGFNKASELVVHHKNRTSDVVWSLLTFGVYYPQTFQIKGKGTLR